MAIYPTLQSWTGPVRDHGIRPLAILVITIAGLIIAAARMPTARTVGGLSVVALFALAVLIGVFALREQQIYLNPRLVAPFAAILGIAIGHQVLAFEAGVAVRLLSQAGIVAVSVLYLPRLMSFQEICAALAVVGTILFLIGLVPVIGGPSEFMIFQFGLWHYPNPYFPFAETSVTSILGNPNNLAVVLTIAGLASLVALSRTGHWIYALILGFMVLGVFATRYRTGMLLIPTAVAIYAAYYFADKRGLMGIAVIGVVGLIVVTVFVAFFRDLVAPATLSWRPQLWAGSARAIIDAPLFGHGFGSGRDAIEPYVAEGGQGKSPHSSFLRVGVETGLIGMVAYAGLFAYIAWGAIHRVQSVADVSMVVFFAGIIIIQIMGDPTVFGTAAESVFMLVATVYIAGWTDSKPSYSSVVRVGQTRNSGTV